MNINKYSQLLAKFILEKTLGRVKANQILKQIGISGPIKDMSPEVRYGEYDITPYLNYGEYNATVAQFHQILEEKLSHCNKETFYENIKRLTIEERKRTESENKVRPFSAAVYYRDKLVIFQEETHAKISKEERAFRKKLREIIVNHELIHMASTVIKEDVTYTGFKRIFEKNKTFAHGLNEGYTERLNRRYFSRDSEYDVYSEEVFIAHGLEQIIGRQKMEQAYFNNDLEMIIASLAKYSSQETAINLIKKLDICTDSSRKDQSAYHRLAGEIRVEIANIYARMQNELRQSNQITQEEFEFNSLKNAFFVKGHILEKISHGYGFKVKNSRQGQIMPIKVYEKLKKTFLEEGHMLPPYDITAHELVPEDIINHTTTLISQKRSNQTELNAMFESNNAKRQAPDSKKFTTLQ